MSEKKPESSVLLSSTTFYITMIVVLILLPFIYFFYIFSLPVSQSKPLITQVLGNYLFIMVAGTACAVIADHLLKKKTVSKDLKQFLFLIFTIFIILYAGFLFLMSVGHYTSFESQAIDVPYFHYAMVQLSHFQIPKIWDIPSRYVWADHISFILILLVPFYWIFPSGTTLMAVEALAVLLGSFPLYFSVRNSLKSRFLGLVVVVSYLTFGGLQMGYAYGFHEILLFPPLFFLLYYFYTQKKYYFYYATLIVCLCVKEEVSLIIFFWGLYLLMFHSQKKVAIVTFCSGFLWYLFAFHIAIPYFNNGAVFGYWGQYATTPASDGLMGIGLQTLFHPLQVLHTLVSPPYKIDTIFHTFSPIVFLPLLFPPSLLILFPSLMEKLLSSNLAGYSGYHYSAAIEAVTLVAVVETIVRIRTYKFTWIPKSTFFWGTLLLYCAVSSNILYGYYPLSPLMIMYPSSYDVSDAELSTLNSAIQQIPSSASVAAHAVIIPHVNIPMGKISHGPKPNETADYIIWDTNLPDYFYSYNGSKVFNSLVTSGKYKILINQNNVILLKRSH